MDAERIATIDAIIEHNYFGSGATTLLKEVCDALAAAQHRADKYRDEAHLLTEERDALQTERDEYKEAFEANNAEIDALQAIPTVHLHNLPPTWQDGDPEPPPEIHVMGTPECVAGLQAVIAERDRLASQVTTLESEVQDWKRGAEAEAHAGDEARERLAEALRHLRALLPMTFNSNSAASAAYGFVARLTPTEEPPRLGNAETYTVAPPGNIGITPDWRQKMGYYGKQGDISSPTGEPPFTYTKWHDIPAVQERDQHQVDKPAD